jgi:hypothetical protein
MKSIGKFAGALTVRRGGAVAKPAENVPAPWVPPASEPWVPPADKARLVFALDATASRKHAWEHAKRLQDRLLNGVAACALEIALAVHSGGKVRFSKNFTSDAGKLRDLAASVECRAGSTKLLPILERVAARDLARTVLYVGDAFEEDAGEARRIADRLRARETRVIILHDGPPPSAFGMIADMTGGTLLPFDTSALDRLGDLLQAVGVYAAGGAEALKTAAPTLPAATLLLENLDPKRLLIGR